MTKVSIDVGAARGAVSTLRSLVSNAFDEWSAVSTQAGRALSSTAGLQALSDPILLLSSSATELDTRIELAVLYNTGSRGTVPTDGVLEYEVDGADSIDNVKQALGEQLADQLLTLSTRGSEADLERFEHYTNLMEQYQDDPVVTDALFERLGPEGVLNVPLRLKDLGESFRNLQNFYREDEHGNPLEQDIYDESRELQQRFLEAWGGGLATSTNSEAFGRRNPDFADDLVRLATENQHGLGWALSQTLRYGVYENGFLIRIGEGLYDWEKDQYGAVWGPQVQSPPELSHTWFLGTEDDGRYFDPFVGLFEAMGRSPEAAADFFNPDGGGEIAQERAEYLIRDRRWQADKFNALGEALAAASLAFHRPDVDIDLQTQSAWIASATIHYLAERDGGRNTRRIGDEAKDSLARILAAYIADVDGAVRYSGDIVSPGVDLQNHVTAPWLDGLPVGASFNRDHLNKVLREVMTDEGAMVTMADAVARWNALRIEASVAGWNADATAHTQGRVNGAVQDSAGLLGYVYGNLEVGLANAGKEKDERAKQFIDLASGVVNMIPVGGKTLEGATKKFYDFLVSEAKKAGKNAATDYWTGNEAAGRAVGEDQQEVGLLDLRIALAAALADSPHLPEESRRDENGQLYPWFTDAGFDESLITEGTMRQKFVEWMNLDAAFITPLLPDLNQAFDDGVKAAGG